jgi:hypothetical protein
MNPTEKIIGIRCCANFDETCKCPVCGGKLNKNVRQGRQTVLVCSERCGWEYKCSTGGMTNEFGVPTSEEEPPKPAKPTI